MQIHCKRRFFGKIEWLQLCLQCFKKCIKTNYKIQGCIAKFLTNCPWGFFGKIDYCYFYLSIVPHHTKMFGFKKILRVNHEVQDFVILVQIGPKVQIPEWGESLLYPKICSSPRKCSFYQTIFIRPHWIKIFKL